MTAEQLGGLGTVLALIITALGTYQLNRGTGVRIRDRKLRAENERLTHQFRATRRYAVDLEELLEDRRIPYPARPPEMAFSWGEDEHEQPKAVGK